MSATSGPSETSHATHNASHFEESLAKWKRRRDIPIAILAWIGVVAVVLWGSSHIIRALLLLIVAALLAYALAPLVRWLERVLPRPLAIVITCLIVLGLLALLIYFVTLTALHQFTSLSQQVVYLLTSHNGRVSPLEKFLFSFGITTAQVANFREQAGARLESFAGSIVPLVSSFLDVLLDVVVVAVITIYLLIDGRRLESWCRRSLPDSFHADFVLDTSQRVVGGYIRGQLLLAVLVGLLVGIGMLIFHVPYALLLGVLAFILEFIPILGTLISGAICTLIALTQGWLIALGVLTYFIVVHILEGDIIGPRIVGEAVGLHPIVSIAALIAGSELFGIWGALLASPVVGLIQAFIIAIWLDWRKTHPEHFQRSNEQQQPQHHPALVPSDGIHENHTPPH
ncbi:AI-2E family transporter [Dictyobacter arantiisoli]|uniref:AI-2E family transporter n=1 Tax=Dictyobacter arantiisoli TaxID=2014874 RepID=A0A5A5TJ99_9CHLR|nr:AI-2E family transporter [Dictyobacter arantiisoli]GCF11497.1 hypothetical protein KDI_50610 [Dictyobacter arantiisoli]